MVAEDGTCVIQGRLPYRVSSWLHVVAPYVPVHAVNIF